MTENGIINQEAVQKKKWETIAKYGRFFYEENGYNTVKNRNYEEEFDDVGWAINSRSGVCNFRRRNIFICIYGSLSGVSTGGRISILLPKDADFLAIHTSGYDYIWSPNHNHIKLPTRNTGKKILNCGELYKIKTNF